MNIKLLSLPNHQLIKSIRAVFNIDEYPGLRSIDNDLLLLSFSMTCDYRLKKKYKSCTLQTLEYYGDRILYSVIADLIYDIFKLQVTEHQLTMITERVTKNTFLAEIMISKDACKYLRGSVKTLFIDLRKHKFHNKCADALEALIGAFFVHLKTIGENYVAIIKKWLIDNTSIITFIKNAINYENSVLTTSEIDNLKKYVTNKQEYMNVDDTIVQIGDAPVNKSSRVIIVDADLPLEQIFSLFHLDLDKSIRRIDDMYAIVGPNGELFGFADTLENAKQDAFNNLLKYGYIMLKQSVKK